eukprot:365702-Chlamydomonas_euryale.AAC.38
MASPHGRPASCIPTPPGMKDARRSLQHNGARKRVGTPLPRPDQNSSRHMMTNEPSMSKSRERKAWCCCSGVRSASSGSSNAKPSRLFRWPCRAGCCACSSCCGGCAHVSARAARAAPSARARTDERSRFFGGPKHHARNQPIRGQAIAVAALRRDGAVCPIAYI